jgi:hypothetical protein
MRNIFALLAFALGCASVPVQSPKAALFDCAASADCQRLVVTNDAWSQAVVYVNGAVIGRVEGKGHDTFPIWSRQLKDGNCASVSVRLLTGYGVIIPAQCEVRGGHFTLDIFEHLANTTLTAWAQP